MTQIAEIDVAYVNPPQAGRKMGSIKTSDGQYYSVWPDKLGLFSPGSKVTVEYESRISDDGMKEFKTIKRVMGAPGGAVVSAPRRVTAPAPAVGGGRSTSEEMFVMGIIGRALQGSGTIPDAPMLTQWVRDVRKAWHDGFANPTDKRSNVDAPFNDEVPF